MEKKYELIPSDKCIFGNKPLFRVRALRDVETRFRMVRKGDVGGYVQYEKNLSQEGKCWIFDEAVAALDSTVCDDAIISENSYINEEARICGSATLIGHAIAGGKSVVGGNALMRDDANILGVAQLLGEATMCDSSALFARGKVYGNATLRDAVSVFDDAHVFGNTLLRGRCMIRGNTMLSLETSTALIGCPVLHDGIVTKLEDILHLPCQKITFNLVTETIDTPNFKGKLDEYIVKNPDKLEAFYFDFFRFALAAHKERVKVEFKDYVEHGS